MEPRLILFDVDGTLIDTAGAGKRAMERAFGEVFGLDGFAEADGVRYAGRTDPMIFEGLARAFGIAPAAFRAERDNLERIFVAALAREMARPDVRRRVLPGVLPLLEGLEASDGVHLGLLTGNLEAGARAKLEPFGLNRFFASGGFASDDADRREIARIARRRLSELTGIAFRPADVTVVGDTEHDVDCARANGYRAVAVSSGWVDRAVLVRAQPDVLLDDLRDPRVLQALGLGEPDQS
jgi:phosphoglycolate phosphatase-like HAD superfamily hydrolase